MPGGRSGPIASTRPPSACSRSRTRSWRGSRAPWRSGSTARASTRRAGKPLSSLEVYDCWLRGLDCLRRGTVEDDERARAFFERALTIDPHSARAHAGISLSHFNEWSCQAWELWDDKERLAFDHASRAAALDDRDALVQIVLGRILLYRRHFDEAARHVDRAIELNPNDADVLAQAAMCRAYLGDAAVGGRAGHKAARLNPRHPGWYAYCAALPLFVLERYAEAVALLAPAPRAHRSICRRTSRPRTPSWATPSAPPRPSRRSWRTSWRRSPSGARPSRASRCAGSST